ncbi:MAG: toll/interleukin-1 receptor domain-containing protein [Phototrophicaceae bacterium]
MAKLFLSYSRRDQQFTRDLFNAFEQRGYDTWVDWEDIPFSSEWWKEIQSAINNHEAVIVVVSSSSLSSQYVNEEIQYARSQNKRIIPVIREDITDPQNEDLLLKVLKGWYDKSFEDTARQNWDYLRTLNWIFMMEGTNFQQGLEDIFSAIETDLEYLREHTRLLTRAQEWVNYNRTSGFLLTGEELSEAEQWILTSENKQPEPTALHNIYILESRRAEDERNARLESLQRQTRRLRNLTILLVTVAILTVAGLVTLVWQTQRTLTTLQDITTERDKILLQSTEASATQSVVLSEVDRQRQVSESLRLSFEAEQQFDDRDPQLLALPLAMQAHNIINSGLYPPAIQRVLSEIAYSPGLLRFFNPEGINLVDAKAHPETVSHLALSYNNQYLATASHDTSVAVWNTENGERVSTFLAHDSRVTSIAFSPSGTQIASGDAGGVIYLWNINRPSEPILLEGHTGRVSDLAFSPDGTRLASASSDTDLIIWNGVDGTRLKTLQNHLNRVTAVQYTPDGAYLVSGDADGTVYIWDAETGVWERFEKRHTRAITAIDIFEDSAILTSSLDGTIIYWEDILNGVFTIYDHESDKQFTAIQFKDQTHALVGTNTGAIWSVPFTVDPTIEKATQLAFIVPVTPLEVTDMVLDAEGRFVYAAYDNGQVAKWELAHGALEWSLKVHTLPVREVVYVNDEVLLTQDFQGRVVRSSLTTDPVQSIALDLGDYPILFPNGRSALMTVPDVSGGLARVDLETQDIMQSYTLPIDRQQTWFSADGSVAFSFRDISLSSEGFSADDRYLVWSPTDGSLLYPLQSDIIRDAELIRLSATGNSIAIIEGDNNLRETPYYIHFFRTEDRSTLATFGNTTRRYTMLAIRPDGEQLLVGYEDGGVELTRDGENRRILYGHGGAVTAAQYSLDGRLVLTGSALGDVVLWDSERGEELRRFPVGEWVTGVAFSPNNRAFVATTLDGNVSLWRIDSDQGLLDWARSNRLIREFSCLDRIAFQIPPFCEESSR